MDILWPPSFIVHRSIARWLCAAPNNCDLVDTRVGSRSPRRRVSAGHVCRDRWARKRFKLTTPQLWQSVSSFWWVSTVLLSMPVNTSAQVSAPPSRPSSRPSFASKLLNRLWKAPIHAEAFTHRGVLKVAAAVIRGTPHAQCCAIDQSVCGLGRR